MPKESSIEGDLQVRDHRQCCHSIKASSSQKCGGFNLNSIFTSEVFYIYITDTSDIKTMEVYQVFIERGLEDIHGLTLWSTQSPSWPGYSAPALQQQHQAEQHH